MKKNLILISLFIFFNFSPFRAFTQTADSPVALLIGFGTKDYQGELGNKLFSKFNANASLGLGFYISPSFDAVFTGSYGQYDFSKNSSEFFTSRNFDANTILKYKFYNGKLLNENAVFAPYLMLGLGYQFTRAEIGVGKSNFDSNGLNIPAGAGFRIRADENVSFFIQTLYNLNFDDQYDGNRTNRDWKDAYFHHSVGFTINLSKKKDTDNDGIADKNDTCPDTPSDVKVDATGCPLDTDKDGIADHLDTCPTEAGLATTNGCPDADKDGIKDSEDECANQAGVAQFKGCPDTDKDGIKDSEDECPNQAGTAQFKGCPDSDGDGVKDSEDKCPNKAGTIANQGCPEIKEEVKKKLASLAKAINFETGSDVLTKPSVAILEQVVAIMKSEADYKLSIEGHTDNTGNADRNMALSQKRAESVKKYITNKGVDGGRINAQGFGITKPVGDNKTATGRTQNRRVELKLDF